MYDFQKWDIWEADVPYREDATRSKTRPVLIISETEVLVLKMTTHNESDKPRPFEYELMRWEQAGLRKQTYVECDRFVRLGEERFTGRKFGRLQAADIIGIQPMMKFHGLIK